MNTNVMNTKANIKNEQQSLTSLLKDFEVPLSARHANEILLKEGILLQLTRASMKNPEEQKHFKIISGKGLEYGKNVASPVHPVETATVFYRNKFPQLIDKVLSRHLVI